MRSLIIFLCCYVPVLSVSAQKKDKNYYEGYVIRFNDTIRCKIYAGPKIFNIAHEIKFKYDDGREMTYNPGSVIKGFGYKIDTAEKNYYVIPVPEYKFNKQKNNKAYAEVLANGHLKFLNYSYKENSSRTSNTGYVPATTSYTQYYLYKKNTDSCINIGTKPLLGFTYFTKEEISSCMSDYPELLSEINENEKLHISDLIKYINRYNEWFSKGRQQ